MRRPPRRRSNHTPPQYHRPRGPCGSDACVGIALGAASVTWLMGVTPRTTLDVATRTPSPWSPPSLHRRRRWSSAMTSVPPPVAEVVLSALCGTEAHRARRRVMVSAT